MRSEWSVTALPVGAWSETDQEAIREQVDRILRSKPFAQSKRRQRFLDYLVAETLAGRADRLKGYSLGVEIFGRPDSFEPALDPIVRVEAGRLREKLHEYYGTEGLSDPIRIDLPKGSYEPQITFRRIPGSGTDGAASEFRSSAQPSRLRIAIPLLALLLVIAAFGAWFTREDWHPQQNAEPSANQIDGPRNPGIAVLPFVNLSGNPSQEYFSDGLTEDILTELAKSRDLRVLARNTSFQYKDKAVNITELGHQHGVDYILEGSVRRHDGRLRVAAQLIDAKTGAHVWANRYDRDLADVFLVQDEIVSQIVGKIAGSYGAIERAEVSQAVRKNPEQVQSYDLVLRARNAIQFDWTRETFANAEDLLRQAISLDPSNARARRELAWFGVMGWIFQLDDPPIAQDEIVAQAAKAVQLDPQDARARMVAASAYFFTKQLDQFRRETDQALALAPYDAEIAATLACMISSSGDRDRGVALAAKAYELNADAATGWYHSTVYTADYLKGDYDRALRMAKQNQDAEMFYSSIEIIPIFGQLGMKQEALEAWKKLQAQLSDVSAKTFEEWWRLWNIPEADIAKLMDGVHKSGVLGAEG